MKILLKIPLSTYTGYGRDGVGMAQALMKAGHDVYLHPTEVQAPLPSDVLALLTKRLEAPFDLTIVHLDPGRLSVDEVERGTTRRLVAWTMWEFDSFDNLKGRSKLRSVLKDYDAVIAYDEVTAGCFKPYYKGPIFTLQGGYDAKEIKYVDREWNGTTFNFFMLGILSQRKNPMLTIKAFGELCSEDPKFAKEARLILKTMSPPGWFVRMEEVYPNLRILYETWDRETLLDFYSQAHCLLAPSYGEGKNLPALEFMTSGGAVIATNWGGMAYWMDEAYAYPLDYELKSMDPYRFKVLSASVKLNSLKSQMLRVFYDREEAQAKGRLASKVIPANHSWDRVVERLTTEIVAQIAPQEVFDESKRA